MLNLQDIKQSSVNLVAPRIRQCIIVCSGNEAKDVQNLESSKNTNMVARHRHLEIR